LYRIKLTPLERYRFTHEQKVYISNINPAGHVGSSQMIDLLHDGRIAMLQSLEASELNLGDGKTGTILSDLAVNFKAELFLHDVITIESDIADIEEKGIRIYYRILKNGKIAALAETGHVCFSYFDKSICNVPDIFIKRLSEVQQIL
jgi:acyl-CoA thioesterase FadM